MEIKFLSTMQRGMVFAAAVCALTFISGCAAVDANPQKLVHQLASQRWNHLVAGQYDKAYALTVPSYRKLKSLDYFSGNLRALPVKWLSAEVIRVECESQTCKVRVKIVSHLNLPTRARAPLESGLDETWVFEDGQWWMFETL
jgi:hypothetical protein